MPESEAHVYGDKTFTQMMYAKVVTVQLINRMGYDVLFQGEPRLSFVSVLSFLRSQRYIFAHPAPPPPPLPPK